MSAEVASAVAANFTTALAKLESAAEVETWFAFMPSSSPLTISVSKLVLTAPRPSAAKSAAVRFEPSFKIPSAPASSLFKASTSACSSAALVGAARPEPIKSFSIARLFAVTPVMPAAA